MPDAFTAKDRKQKERILGSVAHSGMNNWGADPEVDEVIYAHGLEWPQHGGGLAEQGRRFVELYLFYRGEVAKKEEQKINSQG